MFLALNPFDEWWEKDADILLLGPWCAPYSKRKDLATLRWHMLPAPWANRAEFHAASASSDAVYHRLLRYVAEHLNEVHGVREPLAYWRLIVGPWLLHFVHAIRDRYAHLSAALASAPNLRTSVLDEACFRTPRTTSEAFAWLTKDHHYNWQLFSELFSLMAPGLPHRSCVVAAEGAAPSLGSGHGLPRWAGRLRRAQSYIVQAMRSRGRIWLDLGVSKVALIGLVVRSGFRIVPFHVYDELRDARFDPVWDARRTRLGCLPASEDFEHVCVQLLPRHLPTIYLEGFRWARQTVRQRYPHPPTVLASETSWYANETYKYLAAEALGRGARLVAVQHGGGYGLARAIPQEAFEASIGHAYFVWGWAADRPSFRNVPSPLISRHPRWSRPRSSARILFAPQSMQPYRHRLESSPAGVQLEEQWAWQVRFVDALPAHVRTRLVLRPPPVELGQGTRRRLCDRFPEIAIDGVRKFKQSVWRSRITVIEKIGTGLLESLAMNSPTVLFWNAAYWEVRDDAAPYMNALRQAGILWDSPESAAMHVSSVYDDPARWWDSESVQAARRAFVDRFALVRRDWSACWLAALEQELASATGACEEFSS